MSPRGTKTKPTEVIEEVDLPLPPPPRRRTRVKAVATAQPPRQSVPFTRPPSGPVRPAQASDELLDALVQFKEDVDFDALTPRVMEAARAKAVVAARKMPAHLEIDELVSALYMCIVSRLRELDPNMDPPQMMSYIYKLFDFALRDMGRDNDFLPKRTRTRANKFEAMREDYRARRGAEPSRAEQIEMAKQCLGPRQIVGKSAESLIGLLVDGIQHVELGEADAITVDDGLADRVDMTDREQAVHIAIANVADHKIHAELTEWIVTGNTTELSIRASISAALGEEIRKLGITSATGGPEE
jgi:hypothetical protein